MTNEEVLQTLEHLLGTPYEPGIKDTITELTGRDRVLGPNEIATREFDLNRITIAVDDENAIEGFRFG